MTQTSPSRREIRVALFWARVTKTDTCWVHSGSLGSHGYPQATDLERGVAVPAQRVALEVSLGRPLKDGEWGLHKCNNKKCIRVHPDHVYSGDHVKNMDDMARIGHTRRKLTAEEAVEIRRRVTSGELSIRAAAREHEVSQRAVQNLMRGVTYRYAAEQKG